MKRLNEKERLFCFYYAKLQNAKEAYIKADFPAIHADAQAGKLLQRKEISRMIEEITRCDSAALDFGNIIAGLSRLAYTSSADSLKLLLMDREMLAAHVDELDLFHISEIKVPKEGALEIKFFDRFKAFDMLLNILNRQNERGEASDFFNALENSAKSLTDMENRNET